VTDRSSLFSAGVLAGGEDQRMGGADKGLLLLHGQPLVRHVLNALAPQSAEQIISANRNLAHYARLCPRVVCDTAGQGPLAGLAALLAAARYPWLLCVPCDAPQLPVDLASRLLQAALAAKAPASFLHDGHRAHPTFCLVRTTLAASAQLAAASRTGLHTWLTEQGAALVHTAPPMNLNTAEEFAAVETMQ